MKKTLEQRKAEALEGFKECEWVEADMSEGYSHGESGFDCDDASAFLTDHYKTITELLQPTPTDDEVDEAVKTIHDVGCFGGGEEGEKTVQAVLTLIRRATQPKSCDKLVEALEYCSMNPRDMHPQSQSQYIVSRQALAEHRKGVV